MSQNRFSPESRNALVVMGVHHSGAAALSAVLARLGCDLPASLSGADAEEGKAACASAPVQQMNTAILASGGAHRNNLQPFSADWKAFLPAGAQVVSEEFGTSRLFVLNDPQICLIAPFWKRLFELEKIAPVYLHIHRTPAAVATSPNARDAMVMWLRHTLDAEYGTRGAVRCFTLYERLLENPAAAISQIKERTGLAFPPTAGDVNSIPRVDADESAETRAASKEHPLVARWVEQIYGVMEKWAHSGEDVTDFALLDDLRAEFDATAPVFAQLVGETPSAQTQAPDAQREALQKMAQIARVRRVTSQAEFEKTLETSLVARRKKSDQQIQKLTAQNAQLRARNEEITADNRALRSSTSWKITKPLRSVVMLLRRR